MQGRSGALAGAEHRLHRPNEDMKCATHIREKYVVEQVSAMS